MIPTTRNRRLSRIRNDSSLRPKETNWENTQCLIETKSISLTQIPVHTSKTSSPPQGEDGVSCIDSDTVSV